MTKIDWDKYPPIPGFDVLKWKQANQARILRETEGMTDEQIRERFRRASERATARRKELADRRAKEVS